ncbi:hypothetical protein [Actinoplanes sp. NBRC 103695]|uniref:hypothetical protein n=1 Tax=Actinoplanes sp. NBRC 103695 TaxID=3032202 RepID=UPI0024A5DF38|nr:hypothetical protein [Actinoplanes sp. NBRC 103695]GLY98392.1 hypothetical protein Acsp02_56460 [Actinoplanes sp. NBRC 103695]
MRNKPLHRILAVAGLLATGIVLAPASPAHAAIGLYRVSAVSAGGAVSPQTATASCNAGDKATDAGGHINSGNGDVSLTRAFIEDTMDRATAMGVETIPTGAPWDVTAWVTCAPAGTIAGQQLVQASLGYDSTDKKVTATCPANKIAYGGGFKVVSAAGQAAIDEKVFNGAFTSVAVQSYDAGAVGPYTLFAQAVCGTSLPAKSLQVHTSASNSITPKVDSPNACPIGQEASGVGGLINGLTGDGSLDTVRPKAGMTTGEVIAREIGPNATQNWTVQSQVTCVG